jgi:hypothetical protein
MYSSVIFGMLFGHRTKKLELVVKLLSLLLLPVPLFLWPVLVAVGSFLVGVGYGFGTPLVATFEAVGENRESKSYHVFAVRFEASLIFFQTNRCI